MLKFCKKNKILFVKAKGENITMTNKQIIPVFYACDDGFVKYTIVSIKSLMLNASKEYDYVIYVLNAGISEQMKEETYKLKTDGFDIKFVDVHDQLDKIGTTLPLRDYYSKTTYFRIFIADMFPEYKKALYIDSDTVVLGDISELFNVELSDNFVAACHEQAMVQTEVYGNYVEQVMGINRNNYFNAGILLINCDKFRKEKVSEQFIDLLGVYNFVVTQDEDYLNVICHNKVLWLNSGWNTEVYGELPVEEKDIKIIHYIMVAKPWHFEDCRLKDYFWKYAEQTSVIDSIKKDLADYTDEKRKKDIESCDRLAQTAKAEAEREDRYINIVKKNLTPKQQVLDKISRFEREEKFDIDINDDPETIVLMPDKVDYLGEKLKTRFATKIANRVAVWYYEREIRRGNFIIKEINGLENYKAVKGGTIITCNHFSPNDNYAIWRAIRSEFPKGKRLYKIIREGNYTNFKGLYGFFFRHCNTLPLSSNIETLKNLMRAVKTLLKRGERILIYPEQAMWWNYRKPRPLKSGAFKFAAKNNVPVIPSFITMKDTDKLDSLGFNIQEYTIWFLPAIYPKEGLCEKDNVEYLKQENYRVWKELYEKVYDKPLTYGE